MCWFVATIVIFLSCLNTTDLECFLLYFNLIFDVFTLVIMSFQYMTYCGMCTITYRIIKNDGPIFETNNFYGNTYIILKWDWLYCVCQTVKFSYISLEIIALCMTVLQELHFC
jgi:hypothetical protein